MNQILSYNSWDPLEEIWLGDVWPEHFYDDLDPEIRDAFYKITEITKEDLNAIQKKFEEFGVQVHRPIIGNKESCLINDLGKLRKPPITPRDEGCVIGNKLYLGMAAQRFWRHALDTYNKEQVVITQRMEEALMSANTARIGRDIIFDHLNGDRVTEEFFFNRFDHLINEFGNDYRIHFTTNGGHSDGCFATLRPGLLIATGYFSDYDLFFPGWEKINLLEPTYAKHNVNNSSGSGRGHKKWHITDTGNFVGTPHFNSYLERYCVDWIGDYTETYFEVNTVMLDDKNIMCLGYHEELFKKLDAHGITPHIVPFRARTFWDGGLHCLTLDIRRRAVLEDYFPNRGAYGAGIVSSESFVDFKNRYRQWKGLA